jgi:hypothetical protein
MADSVNVPLAGKQSKKAVLAVGAVAAVFVIYMYVRNKQNAANTNTASSASIDPATGYPTGSPEDLAALQAQNETSSGSIDPATGAVYGSVADEQALAQESGTSGYLPATTTATGTSITTNAEWAQEAEATVPPLINSPTAVSDVAAAVGRFLSQLPLTSAQASIIQVAESELGPPPVGSFAIVPQADTTPPASGTPSTPAPSTAAHGPITVTPVNLHVTATSTGSAQVAWLAPSIPANQGPLTGYTVECYDSSGHDVNGPFTVATSQLYANIGGLKAKTAYHVNVWCDPAQSGGPHATVSFTTT